MRLLSRPLGVVRIRWGICPEAGVDAAAVVEVFDPGGDPGVDLVAGGEGTSVVVLGFEGVFNCLCIRLLFERIDA